MGLHVLLYEFLFRRSLLRQFWLTDTKNLVNAPKNSSFLCLLRLICRVDSRSFAILPDKLLCEDDLFIVAICGDSHCI